MPKARLPWLLLGALVAAAALAPGASACTVAPPTLVLEAGPAEAAFTPPCPPASNGGVAVRVAGVGVGVPLPG